jgi:molybdopterin synthase catalytic subunit/molybdopterin converting factor small subunit
MTITVQFFSFLRPLVGQNELQLELASDSTVADALAELYHRFPKLREAEKTTLIAIGVDFAKRDSPLRDGDILALMPPLQGGTNDELLITDQPINLVEAQVGSTAGEVGGIVVFWGVVRDTEDGKKITALEYTAYREMAEHQFHSLLAETRKKWPLKRIRVVHRLGVIAVGEPSLLVRVEAAHRGEAFAAAQFIIDELKEKVPIWKRGGVIETAGQGRHPSP